MAVSMWPVPERPHEAWTPFMVGLLGEVRRERRRRAWRRVSAAACLALGLWAGFSLLGRGPAAPLRAEVPTAESPVFQPDGTNPEGAVVMVVSQ